MLNTHGGCSSHREDGSCLRHGNGDSGWEPGDAEAPRSPRKKGDFFSGREKTSLNPLGDSGLCVGGSNLPGSQISRTLKHRDIPMDEPHWTQALAALDSGP